MKCPSCGTEMIESKTTIQVAQKNPERGGYFGETAAEYGMSDQDRYETLTRDRCPNCGYETLPR